MLPPTKSSDSEPPPVWLALPFAFVQAVTADSSQSQASSVGQPSIAVYQTGRGWRISPDT